jgi:hypothetical protein
MTCVKKIRNPSTILICLSLLLLASTSFATPDPCLIIYPSSPCEYHYESAEYYTVTSGHPLYDPAYDRGGEVLIEVGTNIIALSVYQAPNLIGFVLDEDNQGFYAIGNVIEGVVDGFNNSPTTFVNILLVFDQFEPDYCVPIISVDGNPALFDPNLGWYYPIGDLVVSTPTPEGNNFSDTVNHLITWVGCHGLRVYAFSDENFNLKRDGSECKTAFSHDLSIPVNNATWGNVKALY